MEKRREGQRSHLPQRLAVSADGSRTLTSAAQDGSRYGDASRAGGSRVGTSAGGSRVDSSGPGPVPIAGSRAGGSIAGGSVAGGLRVGSSGPGQVPIAGSRAGGSIAGGSRYGGSFAGGSVAGGSVAGRSRGNTGPNSPGSDQAWPPRNERRWGEADLEEEQTAGGPTAPRQRQSDTSGLGRSRWEASSIAESSSQIGASRTGRGRRATDTTSGAGYYSRDESQVVPQWRGRPLSDTGGGSVTGFSRAGSRLTTGNSAAAGPTSLPNRYQAGPASQWESSDAGGSAAGRSPGQRYGLEYSGFITGDRRGRAQQTAESLWTTAQERPVGGGGATVAGAWDGSRSGGLAYERRPGPPIQRASEGSFFGRQATLKNKRTSVLI